eukprot:1143642-Pelagomonas_calceolata.AAC.5
MLLLVRAAGHGTFEKDKCLHTCVQNCLGHVLRGGLVHTGGPQERGGCRTHYDAVQERDG